MSSRHAKYEISHEIYLKRRDSFVARYFNVPPQKETFASIAQEHGQYHTCNVLLFHVLSCKNFTLSTAKEIAWKVVDYSDTLFAYPFFLNGRSRHCQTKRFRAVRIILLLESHSNTSVHLHKVSTLINVKVIDLNIWIGMDSIPLLR